MDASSDNGSIVSGRSTTAAGILQGMSNFFGAVYPNPPNPGSGAGILAVPPAAGLFGLPKDGDYVKLHFSEPVIHTLPGIVKGVDSQNKTFNAMVLINDKKGDHFIEDMYTLQQMNDDPDKGDWAPLPLDNAKLVDYIVDALNKHVKRISVDKQQPNLYLNTADIPVSGHLLRLTFKVDKLYTPRPVNVSIDGRIQTVSTKHELDALLKRITSPVAVGQKRLAGKRPNVWDGDNSPRKRLALEKKRFKCGDKSCNGTKARKMGPCNNEHCPRKAASANAGDGDDVDENGGDDDEEEEEGGEEEEGDDGSADTVITDDAIAEQEGRVDQMSDTHQANLRLLDKQPPALQPPRKDANTDAMEYSELMMQVVTEYEAQLGQFKAQLQRAREQAHRSQLALRETEARLDNMREFSDAQKLLTAAKNETSGKQEEVFASMKATNMDLNSPRVTGATEAYHKAEAEVKRLQSKVEEAREKLRRNVARL